jgi:hypothetical protein
MRRFLIMSLAAALASLTLALLFQHPGHPLTMADYANLRNLDPEKPREHLRPH